MEILGCILGGHFANVELLWHFPPSINVKSQYIMLRTYKMKGWMRPNSYPVQHSVHTGAERMPMGSPQSEQECNRNLFHRLFSSCFKSAFTHCSTSQLLHRLSQKTQQNSWISLGSVFLVLTVMVVVALLLVEQHCLLLLVYRHQCNASVNQRPSLGTMDPLVKLKHCTAPKSCL